MKKNYTSPVVEVNAFDFEDVVMTSSVYSLKKNVDGSNASYEANVALLREKAAATAIIVEW